MRDSDSAEGGAKREADARCGPASCAQIAMPEVDTLKISNDDAAFILGKNGKTKEKIARVSGADLDLFEHSLTLEIRGTDEERRRAKKYEGRARDTRAQPWPRHIRPPSFASAAARWLVAVFPVQAACPRPSSRRYDNKPAGTGDCGGNGLCCTCVVSVTAGLVNLTPKKASERQLLANSPGRYRQSCKARISVPDDDQARIRFVVGPRGEASIRDAEASLGPEWRR